MLIDWPNHKPKVQILIEREIRQQAFGPASLMAQIPNVVLNEGTRLVLIDTDGSRQPVELHSEKVSTRLDASVLSTQGLEPIMRVVEELGTGLNKQIERDIVEKLKDVSRQQGAFVKGKPDEMGRQLLDAIRDIEVSFDDDGNPELIMMLDSHIDAIVAELNTVELYSEFKGIIEEKRSEWIRRENRRRLVD